jgi:hypothetical protein
MMIGRRNGSPGAPEQEGQPRKGSVRHQESVSRVEPGTLGVSRVRGSHSGEGREISNLLATWLVKIWPI